jgi:hypothetical protein
MAYVFTALLFPPTTFVSEGAPISPLMARRPSKAYIRLGETRSRGRDGGDHRAFAPSCICPLPFDEKGDTNSSRPLRSGSDSSRANPRSSERQTDRVHAQPTKSAKVQDLGEPRHPKGVGQPKSCPPFQRRPVGPSQASMRKSLAPPKVLLLARGGRHGKG